MASPITKSGGRVDGWGCAVAVGGGVLSDLGSGDPESGPVPAGLAPAGLGARPVHAVTGSAVAGKAWQMKLLWTIVKTFLEVLIVVICLIIVIVALAMAQGKL